MRCSWVSRYTRCFDVPRYATRRSTSDSSGNADDSSLMLSGDASTDPATGGRTPRRNRFAPTDGGAVEAKDAPPSPPPRSTQGLTRDVLVGLARIERATSAVSVPWTGVVSQALTWTYAVSDLRFPPVVTHT